ncbi:DNA-primase RepB domain-containing protein [Phyllobacterium sp. SB3]|uniref:DNA-primase RepB domain-containing protein n=1 Tax=Phyllobacterium sp. SB3 TaxID=3156073 RepID=UPI0032AF0DCF
MIGKLVKGAGARGLVDYLLGTHDMNGNPRERVNIIGGTMAGTSGREIAAEFGQLRALKSRVGKAVAHQCLRLPEGDPIPDDATWSRIADRWAGEMGFESYITVCHGNHIHIAASRINPDGQVVSDAHDWRRSESAIRKIETEFELTQIESSHLLEPEKATDHRKAPDRGQIAMAERGEVPPSTILAEMIDSRLAEGCTVSSLVEHLEAHGVIVRPNISATGSVSGLAYQLDGTDITAKAMGRGFTWSNMQKRGLSYEQDRDFQTLRAASYREAGEGTGVGYEKLAGRDGADPTLERSLDPSAGSVSETDFARCASAGRDDPDYQGSSGSVIRSTDRDGESQSRCATHSVDARAPSAEAGRSGTESRAAGASAEPKRPLDDGGDSGDRNGSIEPGSDLERLVVLAITASRDSDRSKGTQGDNDRGSPNKGLVALKLRASEIIDGTKKAVHDYLEAVPAATYRLQIVRPEKANVNRQGQSPDMIMNAVGWLKSENARGGDIYIRPEDRRYILMDDLSLATIRRLKNDGFAPAAVLETSRNNFAAWIRITAPEALEPSPKAATIVAKSLAKIYGADPAAADHAHLSRLPGFTNRKPTRLVEGKSPFVILREASGTVARTGSNLIKQVRRWIVHKARLAAVKASSGPLLQKTRDGDHLAAFRVYARQHSEEMGQEVDWNLVDFRAGQDMALAGWSRELIADAITEASPGILDRKGDRAEGYAARTSMAACVSDRVQAELKRREAEEKLLKFAELSRNSSSYMPRR